MTYTKCIVKYTTNMEFFYGIILVGNIDINVKTLIQSNNTYSTIRLGKVMMGMHFWKMRTATPAPMMTPSMLLMPPSMISSTSWYKVSNITRTCGCASSLTSSTLSESTPHTTSLLPVTPSMLHSKLMVSQHSTMPPLPVCIGNIISRKFSLV